MWHVGRDGWQQHHPPPRPTTVLLFLGRLIRWNVFPDLPHHHLTILQNPFPSFYTTQTLASLLFTYTRPPAEAVENQLGTHSVCVCSFLYNMWDGLHLLRLRGTDCLSSRHRPLLFRLPSLILQDTFQLLSSYPRVEQLLVFLGTIMIVKRKWVQESLTPVALRTAPIGHRSTENEAQETFIFNTIHLLGGTWPWEKRMVLKRWGNSCRLYPWLSAATSSSSDWCKERAVCSHGAAAATGLAFVLIG